MKPDRVLFARVGWMKRYKGKQADDERPIGGGDYNQDETGHELFNFLPIGDRVYGYFQPAMKPPAVSRRHPSSVRLQRVESGYGGDTLNGVLVIFIARRPGLGGQCIVGWYRNATVHRQVQMSGEKRRDRMDYYVEAAAEDATLLPEPRRLPLPIPKGKGRFGQANVCYALSDQGQPKPKADWMSVAIHYVSAYQHENASQDPESETDPDIAEIVDSTIERSAGFQSNPQIRRAIEQYAMGWALRRLNVLGLMPIDTHKNESLRFRLHGCWGALVCRGQGYPG
jgi:hypothetical protein